MGLHIRGGAGAVFHPTAPQGLNRHEFFLAYARAMGHDDSLLKAATLGDKRMEMLLMPDCSLSSEITFRRLGLRFKSPQEGFEAMGKAPADALEGVAALQIGKDRMNGQALPTTQDDPDR